MIVKPDKVTKIEISCSSELAAFRLSDALRTKIGKENADSLRNIVRVNPAAMASPEATIQIVAETVHRLGMK